MSDATKIKIAWKNQQTIKKKPPQTSPKPKTICHGEASRTSVEYFDYYNKITNFFVLLRTPTSFFHKLRKAPRQEDRLPMYFLSGERGFELLEACTGSTTLREGLQA
jgi:hypothetical protein